MRPARTVLLAGFEPFGGSKINASEEAVRALEGREIKRRRVVTLVLPVRFDNATELLRKQARALNPELVICVGEASGRSEISIERIAINIDDARIPDNAGAQPIDRAIAPHGPLAYRSTLPIQSILGAVRESGVPVSVSESAGTFVCNHVFYGLMRTLRRTPQTRGGFIHVPCLPSLAEPSSPSMSREQIVLALEIAIATCLRD